MFETVDRLLLASLGALSMTRERAEKIFEDFVQRGKAEKESQEGFVRELMDAADKNRKQLEEIVSKQVEKATAGLKLAAKEDIERLEKKLDKVLGRKR